MLYFYSNIEKEKFRELGSNFLIISSNEEATEVFKTFDSEKVVSSLGFVINVESLDLREFDLFLESFKAWTKELYFEYLFVAFFGKGARKKLRAFLGDLKELSVHFSYAYASRVGISGDKFQQKMKKVFVDIEKQKIRVILPSLKTILRNML